MSNESAGDRHFSNEEMERLLAGSDRPDSTLGRYLARLQNIAGAKPEAKVAARDLVAIVRELEKARGRRPGRTHRSLSTTSPVGGSRVLIPSRRLAPRNALVGFAAVVMTAGMAAAATGNLPAPAQDLVSKTMALIGIDIAPAPTVSTEPARVGSTVPIGGDLPPEGDSAGDPTGSGVEIPEPSVDTSLLPPERPGPTSEEPYHQEVPVDPPDERVVVMPPSQPGPSEDQDPVDDARPPTDPGSAANPVPPDHAGPVDNPGPPDHAGPVDNPGPPDHAGPADNPGPPDHAAAGEPGQSHSAFRTSE